MPPRVDQAMIRPITRICLAALNPMHIGPGRGAPASDIDTTWPFQGCVVFGRLTSCQVMSNTDLPILWSDCPTFLRMPPSLPHRWPAFEGGSGRDGTGTGCAGTEATVIDRGPVRHARDARLRDGRQRGNTAGGDKSQVKACAQPWNDSRGASPFHAAVRKPAGVNHTATLITSTLESDPRGSLSTRTTKDLQRLLCFKEPASKPGHLVSLGTWNQSDQFLPQKKT